ncbi:MAG: hypothetical protein KBD39_08445 [Sterolibacterium sp.]|nr:hypothetical protein [Sterolibacterium sp.]MBP9800131.1 hypothetical protein [Sterolibacterium sp.]
MFSRLYFVISLFALAYFTHSQYRGISPFDTNANALSNASRSGTSSIYHK